MNETDTIQKDAAVGSLVTVLFTSLAVMSVLIDVIYIIVCFKALKKTFHHLTILVLFFSDITLGISSTLFSLGTLVTHEHVGSCLLQIQIVAFGMLSNYCLIFLLCLQRYLVVSSHNFGIVDTFDKNKYKYIGGSLCVVLVVSFCGTVLTPHAEFMQICRPPVVYGDHFYIFITVIFLPISVVIFLLLVMSVITSFRIWQIYFKSTVAPMHVMRERKNNICNVQTSPSIIGQDSATSSQNVSIGSKRNKSEADGILIMTVDSIDIQLDTLSAKLNCDNTVLSKKHSCTHEDKGMNDLKSNTNICSTSKDVAISIDANTQLQKSWEIRAFFTTIIIAFQTVVLTTPLVASYWMEVLSSTPLTLQVRIILVFPFLINSLSNPFIYAWRIPEIRQEFRRLFRINPELS
ncbi:uncharacterized protein LOC134686244 [Mytilus trossulus]|uniref:uncharacterized protein LOC134686244 n=1 Tax=Mytilus trossulus TaxID=6551 RepID=UPI003007A196